MTGPLKDGKYPPIEPEGLYLGGTRPEYEAGADPVPYGEPSTDAVEALRLGAVLLRALMSDDDEFQDDALGPVGTETEPTLAEGTPPSHP